MSEQSAFTVHLLLVVRRGDVGMRNKATARLTFLPGLPDAASDLGRLAGEAMLRDLEKAEFKGGDNT